MRRTTLCSLAVALAALMAAGCTISKIEPPPLTGPSELALSLQLTANPSTLQQDGASQSLIRITARGPNGEPARSVALRAEITLGGTIVDFGRLSARTLVTDNNGEASLVYTAPPFVGEPVDTVTIVTILVTPAETDNRNAIPRQLDIRLVPPGVLVGPNAPPTARFSFSPANPLTFQNVSFDASASTDPDGVIVSYAWDFGDGSTASTRVAQHEYRQSGIYNVSVTVTDDRGLRNTSPPQAVTVGGGVAPTAAFTFSPTLPAINQDIVFNAAASTAGPGRTIVRYDWNFGSGSPQQGQVVTKAYDVPGTYTVTLTVTDDTGARSTAQQSVSVSVTPAPSGPVASFTFSPTNPSVGTAVNFNGSGSTAPGSTIVSWAWDFGDGGTGSGQTTTHTYNTAASYVVRLTVTDASGRTGTTTQQVTVTPPTPPANPIASFTFSPTNPAPLQQVNFDASGSTSPSGAAIVSYEWNFGDGIFTPPSASAQRIQHAYTAAGTYVVRLTVADSAGRTGTTTQTVTVSSPAPTASFTFSPTSPAVNEPVLFNASASRAATGRTIVRYDWNFGNGSTFSSAQPVATNTYSVPGTYNVTLLVTDDVGSSGSAGATVTVTPTSQGTPQPTFTFSPTNPRVGTVINFNGSSSTAPGSTIVLWAWDFGDGTRESGPTATHQLRTHSYTAAFTYVVRLTVTDSLGRTGSFTANVTVVP